MNEPTAHLVYEFADFQVDPAQRLLVLSSGGRALPLSPRAFDALVYFLEHRGQLLEKSTLMEAIWPTVVVEENNLNQHISALRRVLGESRDEHRFILTVPGRGYQFVADVTVRDLSKPPEKNLSAPAPGTLPELGATPVAEAPITRAVSKAKPWLRYWGWGAATALLLTVALMGSLRPRAPIVAASTHPHAAAPVSAPPVLAPRVVWGSDWPHPNLGAHEKPNDALLFELLSQWAPRSADRDRILVENPGVLYGFPKSA